MVKHKKPAKERYYMDFMLKASKTFIKFTAAAWLDGYNKGKQVEYVAAPVGKKKHVCWERYCWCERVK